MPTLFRPAGNAANPNIIHGLGQKCNTLLGVRGSNAQRGRRKGGRPMVQGGLGLGSGINLEPERVRSFVGWSLVGMVV